jgi:hypothetical protein
MAPSTLRTAAALLLMLVVAGLATALPTTAAQQRSLLERGGRGNGPGGNPGGNRGPDRNVTAEDILDRLGSLDATALAEKLDKMNVTTVEELADAIIARLAERDMMDSPRPNGNGTRGDCNVTAADIQEKLEALTADELTDKMAKWNVTTIEELVEAMLAAGPKSRNNGSNGRRGGDRNLLGRGGRGGRGGNVTLDDILEKLNSLDEADLFEKMDKMNVTTVEELAEALLARQSMDSPRRPRDGSDSDTGGNFTREEMVERLQERLESLDDSDLEELMEKLDAESLDELVEAILEQRTGGQQEGGSPRPNQQGGRNGGSRGGRMARRLAM